MELYVWFFILQTFQFTFNLCYADHDGAYMRNPDDGFKVLNDWMKKLSDDIQISEIAFPGTDLSAGYEHPQELSRRGGGAVAGAAIEAGIKILEKAAPLIQEAIYGDSSTTQALSLKEQLEYGIRVFDLHLWNHEDTFEILHWDKSSGVTFGNFLSHLGYFLSNHPSETVLLILSEPRDEKGNTKSSRARLEEYLRDCKVHKKSFFLKTNSYQVKLKEARGKFIIISKEENFHDLGINYFGNKFSVWEKPRLNNNWNLHDWAWMPAKRHIASATSGKKDTFYVTFITARGGLFPYFAASGHSSHYTSAPRLATGLATPFAGSTYEDFPRTDCVAWFCTIAYEGLNTLTRDKIKEYNKNKNQVRTVGIIMAYFPGTSLIQTIIDNNFKLQK